MGNSCSAIAIPALSHVQLLPASGASFPVLRAGLSDSSLLCVVAFEKRANHGPRTATVAAVDECRWL